MTRRYSKGDLIQQNWEILELLGEGYSAAVYAARSGRSVNALKIMHPQRAEDAALRERFEREATMLLRLKHRSLINVIGLSYTAHDEPFMVMELLDGQTLGDLLEAHGRLRARRALELFEQLVRVVGFIHEQGVLHRDLKPANIMIMRSGQLKLLDFGISRNPVPGSFATVHGAIMGTPMYMAPEQARGETEHIDERSDLFAVGLILHEMLSGKAPRDAEMIAALRAAANQPVEPLDGAALGLPRELVEFVSALVRAQQSQRFDSARQILHALLHRVRPALGQPAPPDEASGPDNEILAMLEQSGMSSSSPAGAQATQLDELAVAEIAAQDATEPDLPTPDIQASAPTNGYALPPTRPHVLIRPSVDVSEQLSEDTETDQPSPTIPMPAISAEPRMSEDLDEGEWDEEPTNLYTPQKLRDLHRDD